MNINAQISITPETEKRFQNFIVFEPSSVRIKESDILVRGEKVVEMFDYIQEQLESDSSLDALIIKNRLRKMIQMLQLLTSFDGLIMTKFYDRVWRRFSAVSNIGEYFLDLTNFVKFFPENESKKAELVTIRIEEDEEDFEAGDTADSNDTSDTDASDEKEATATDTNADTENKEEATDTENKETAS
jgi:hypothetical protein